MGRNTDRHDVEYGQACESFDTISAAIYFGPAFRDLLMRSDDARHYAACLASAIREDNRLYELMNRLDDKGHIG